MKKIYLLVVISFLGCKKDKLNDSVDNTTLKNDTVAIIFPNVIESDRDVDGEVFYNFDEYNKIKNKIGSGNISRYIHLYTYIDTFSINDPQYFNHVKKDTFITQNINKINFKIKINNKGKYYINTLIKDIIIFDTVSNDVNSPAKISEVVLSKEITVK